MASRKPLVAISGQVQEIPAGDVVPVLNGGTGVTTKTGTGSVVLSDSPTLVTPALGTPSSGVTDNLTTTTTATAIVDTDFVDTNLAAGGKRKILWTAVKTYIAQTFSTLAQLAASGGAALIGNTPAGNIAATTVQAAINELDTEKALLGGSASQNFAATDLTASGAVYSLGGGKTGRMLAFEGSVYLGSTDGPLVIQANNISAINIDIAGAVTIPGTLGVTGSITGTTTGNVANTFSSGDMDVYAVNSSNASHYSNDSISHLPVSPSGTAQWWNTLSIGISSRTTQIACQAYNSGNGYAPQNDIQIRSKHDTTWSAWQRILHSGNFNGYAAALAGSASQNFAANALTAKSLAISGTNSTDNILMSISSTMTLNADVFGQYFAPTLVGGAATVTSRGAYNAITVNPTHQLTYVIGDTNVVTLNNGFSSTNVHCSQSALYFGPASTSGTAISNVYGYHHSFVPDAAATSDITIYEAYYCANIADGTGSTVGSARAFSGLMDTGANRRNLYMSGTAINYLNGALLIGSDTDDGVNKLQVTGAATFTGGISAAGINATPIGVTTPSTGMFTGLTINNNNVDGGELQFLSLGNQTWSIDNYVNLRFLNPSAPGSVAAYISPIGNMVISGAISGASYSGGAISGTTGTFTGAVSSLTPSFSVYKGSPQTGISSATWTKVTFDTEEFDTNANFASSAFTPTVAGRYVLNAALLWSSTSATDAQAVVAIYKNGAIWKAGFAYTNSSTQVQSQISTIVSANGSTDYFEVYAYRQSGTGDISSSAIATVFNGIRVDQ